MIPKIKKKWSYLIVFCLCHPSQERGWSLMGTVESAIRRNWCPNRQGGCEKAIYYMTAKSMSHTYPTFGSRGKLVMLTVELLPVILRNPGNQQKCQKWEMRKEILVIKITGIGIWKSADFIVIPGIILGSLITQVFYDSVEEKCVCQKPEQGHLAIFLFFWSMQLGD